MPRPVTTSKMPLHRRSPPRLKYIQTSTFHTSAALKRPLAQPATTTALHRKSLENQSQAPTSPQCLHRLPTSNLLRNLVLGAWFSSPYLFQPGLSLMRTIANSKSVFLNPDANPVLGAAVKLFIYNHFCAGTNKREIDRTKAEIKRIGFEGIVLCYGRETGVGEIDGSKAGSRELLEAEVGRWREGNLETLDMMDEGDWMGIKSVIVGLCRVLR